MANVLILGATSAIAAAAARLYAARGERLYLVGRSPEKLAALQAELGAAALVARADFDDTARAPQIIADAVAALGSIDVALVAQGYLGDQLGSERDFAEAERILRTNFLDVVALLIPLANQLEAAGRGRIGVITSVAGERGRPRNFTYGAAKGGLGVYLQGLRSRLHSAGVTVTTLKVGPVDTPMTVDHPKNALFSQPDAVARTLVAAIDRGEGEAFVPRWWRPIMSVVRNTPEALFQRLRALSGR
jgi:decaprenylphospho-beta-D-erythro-pentofuranosid-2-ulose 2-reductase